MLQHFPEQDLFFFQYLLRHYVIQHRKNEQWLAEALALRGIKYTPIYLRARRGKLVTKLKLAGIVASRNTSVP